MSGYGTGSLLSPNDQMEALSRAYVAAVSASAGFVSAVPEVDRDSIDVMISAGGAMRPQLGLQLKATKGSAASDPFSFSLKMKNYDDLREQTMVPRLLVVFAMPAQPSSWLNHNPSRLILRRCAYWKSLAGSPASDNETAVTVQISKAQVFDKAALLALMDKARNGVAL